ncbi:hypothetical protein GDO78_011090 [Eleutherodactylus coqui]|uniref:Uncharacterized protein n=1 Tax=Eleutherodactylus coqui TaxID=57060 RepID=A0A8J6F7Z3_ELECQ|nr:hypothetical protein GDO78_011090 [Eleutherodactylus coqui]
MSICILSSHKNKKTIGLSKGCNASLLSSADNYTVPNIRIIHWYSYMTSVYIFLVPKNSVKFPTVVLSYYDRRLSLDFQCLISYTWSQKTKINF